MKIEAFREELLRVGVLPGVFRQQAEEQGMTLPELERLILDSSSADRVVMQAFDWLDTTEGEDFWSDVYEILSEETTREV